ncbi:DUF3383 domain-containing protein [Rhodospirillum sp. A1_3_36]|uniref:DUF3383 domain-containing protein n=1 Tax=Rhodospirillum sp. A1_3_36 TaxID=3391666 RepID=UPI0039A71FAA
MVKELSVDRVVNVTINLQPLAAARRNFGVLLIAGASSVIDQAERIRTYTDLDGVLADFGTLSPEYAAAVVFFGQSPRPKILRIGRWVKADAPAILRGAALTTEEADIGQWTGIDAGSLTITVGGVEQTVSNLDISASTTLEGIAAIIDAALGGVGAGLTYDGERFILSTAATGAAASLGWATGALAAQMKLTVDTGLAPVGGVGAETPLQAVADLADLASDWYGVTFADPDLTVDQHIAVAGYIQASAKARMYAVTITDTRVMDSTYVLDLASRLKALGYTRTTVAYSANPYAIISALGRAFTVNFNMNRSTITLKFKQLVGIVAEGLRETQALALAGKRCNVFAAYDNDTAIFQEGVMCGDAYFDEIHGLDWLANAIQVSAYNLLYQSKTKIPQTDSGVNQIITAIEGVLAQAVSNGLIAPGIWNADGFGQLERGDRLDKGWYIYAQRVDDQDQSEREQRKAPPIQIAAKLAGAIHSLDIAIDVNR